MEFRRFQVQDYLDRPPGWGLLAGKPMIGDHLNLMAAENRTIKKIKAKISNSLNMHADLHILCVRWQSNAEPKWKQTSQRRGLMSDWTMIEYYQNLIPGSQEHLVCNTSGNYGEHLAGIRYEMMPAAYNWHLDRHWNKIDRKSFTNLYLNLTK